MASLNMFGEYVGSLGEYSRCFRGMQITLPTIGGPGYDGTVSYAGARVTSAGQILVDHTVRVAPSAAAAAAEFHEADPNAPVFGNWRVLFLFELDPLVEKPTPVHVSIAPNSVQGWTVEVRKLEPRPFERLLP